MYLTQTSPISVTNTIFMNRYNSESSSRIRLLVPSFFVQQPRVKMPPPVPGTVSAASLSQASHPRFLVPWPSAAVGTAQSASEIVDWGCDPHQPIPCEVDRDQLQEYLKRFRVRETVENIFMAHGRGALSTAAVVDAVMASGENPFSSSKRDNTDVVWTVDQAVRPDITVDASAPQGHRKSDARHHRITASANAWSISTFATAAPERVAGADKKDEKDFLKAAYSLKTSTRPVIRKNIVYDGDGVAVAQVDFGHGSSVGIHVHRLVEHNLDHVATSFEDHLFHFVTVPWQWTCIPIDTRCLVSQEVAASYFAQHPSEGRTSAEVAVPSVVQREINMGRLLPQQMPAPVERNPFAGHLPADAFLTYAAPTTIDWDTLEEVSWRWLAVDLPFEDYAAMSATNTSE